jgi:hypothetical protein
MIKRSLLIALATMLITAQTVLGGSAACQATSSPVLWGTNFSMTYDGLTGNIYYWLRMDQSTEHFGHHPEGLFLTDPDGSGQLDFTDEIWTDPREGLEIGPVRVRLYPASVNDTGVPELTGNGPRANCQFKVI